jgi:redox-sensing transcriptional repressor
LVAVPAGCGAPEVQMAAVQVPEIVVRRLPLYLRELVQMGAEGKEITSSHELGERLGISSAAIRKDLSQFGEFGKQGTGYNIAFLIGQLKRILKVEKVWDVVVVGIGDLGRAVARNTGFVDRGLRIVALFDSDSTKVGTRIGDLTVESMAYMADSIRALNVRVAMLAVPAHQAQAVADKLVEAGIQAILCYTPTSLSLPGNVRIEYLDPVLRMQQMTYFL